MLADAERTARRVLGGAHPDVVGIENELRIARAALRARETPPLDDGRRELRPARDDVRADGRVLEEVRRHR